MKIKVFRFRVNNASSNSYPDDLQKEWYQKGIKEIASEEMIEKTVNNFIEDKNVVSITVTSVDAHYHNNARGNTIDLIYTIMYQ